MAQVQTTAGLVDEALLSRKTYTAAEDDNSITEAREWFMGEQMVRRDVWVTVKRGHELTAEKGM